MANEVGFLAVPTFVTEILVVRISLGELDSAYLERRKKLFLAQGTVGDARSNTLRCLEVVA